MSRTSLLAPALLTLLAACGGGGSGDLPERPGDDYNALNTRVNALRATNVTMPASGVYEYEGEARLAVAADPAAAGLAHSILRDRFVMYGEAEIRTDFNGATPRVTSARIDDWEIDGAPGLNVVGSLLGGSGAIRLGTEGGRIAATDLRSAVEVRSAAGTDAIVIAPGSGTIDYNFRGANGAGVVGLLNADIRVNGGAERRAVGQVVAERD